MSDPAPNPRDLLRDALDAYAPGEIAEHVEQVGVRKARLDAPRTLTLAILAGAFIAFGGMNFTLVMTGAEAGFGVARLIGGFAFSLGLILVVIAGAELFTGNNLIAMAWADSKITTTQMLRNWGLVYLGNLVGSLATAVLLYSSGVLDLGGGAVAATARSIAEAKVSIPFAEAFLRGVLCNVLVCLAVWLSFAAHTVVGKSVAIVFPISAFVALGFEHSVANMYLIPVGALAGADGVTVASFFGNLVPVSLGNIVGGSGMVALVYWVIYLRKPFKAPTEDDGDASS